MIDVFVQGAWKAEAALVYSQDALGVDQFTYYLGWVENSTDSIAIMDYVYVVQALGYTVTNDQVILQGNYVFQITPGNYLTEVLARANAMTVLTQVINGFKALGYTD